MNHARSRLRFLFAAIAIGGLISLGTSNAFSGVRYVAMNSVNPTPPYANWASAAHTIQDAVDAAQVGDTVLVTNGVYDVGERALSDLIANRIVIDKAITVQSVNGPDVTVIDGANEERCAYVGDGAVLSGFTLTKGLAFDALGRGEGGGVWCASNGVVTNCTLTGNSSGDGGGASGGTIYNCTLTQNRAYLDGGGAISSTLFKSLVTSNVASVEGGGTAYAIVYNCSLTQNHSSNGGGGASLCILSNCVVTGNYSDGHGGGVDGGTLYNCTLTGNSGGAVAGGGSFLSTLYNCALLGNFSYDGGGASGGTLYNCTLTGNSAQHAGGGTQSGTLYNCIVYYNSATNGPNCDSSSSLNYCCTTPLPLSGTGNIAQKPGFVNLAEGNCHLQFGSPCINAGINQDWMSGATDLDGNPRIIRGVVDMGAYEFQLYDGIDLTDPTQALADLDGDGLSNLMEYALGTDPRNPADAQTAMVISVTNTAGTNYLILQFKRRHDTTALPVQYIPEVSGDKSTWFSDSTHVAQVGVVKFDVQFDRVTVRDMTPMIAPRFIRLRVVEN